MYKDIILKYVIIYMVRTSWKSITQMTYRILYAQNFEAQKLPVLL